MTSPNTEQETEIARTLGVDRAGAGKPQWKHWLLWGGTFVVAVLVFGLIWYAKSRTAHVQYETQPVRRGNLRVTVSATGRLEPIKKVNVGIEVSGTIRTVEVDYNDRVKIGQVLARLDTSRLQAQTLQSEAALESARARVAQAQANSTEAEAYIGRLAKLRELSGGKMPTQSELDSAQGVLARAKAEKASAKAAVAQAQATLKVNHTDLAKAVICSPINGVVLSRAVEPGQTVASAFQSPVLFTLAEDLSQLQLLVNVDEADVGRVRQGQEATFTVDAYPNQTFPARIAEVRFGSETVGGVVTYKTVLQVDNSSLTLLPGMTANAVMTVQTVTNALLVPNAVLRFSPPQKPQAEKPGPGGFVNSLMPRLPPAASKPAVNPNENSKTQQVWVFRDGQVSAVEITKGVTDGVMTEVTGGALKPGMELVTDVVTADR